ncbi:hypothetical protein ABH932_007226 [Streptacidiphilus sp. MAP5-52]
MLVLIAYSSSAHRNLDLLSTSRGTCYLTTSLHRTTAIAPAAICSTYRSSAVVSSGPCRRNARGNARRRSADARQPDSGCRYAPRPGNVPRGSGTHAPSTAVTRSRSCLADRFRHPTQVRSGHAAVRVRPDTSKSTPLMVLDPTRLSAGDQALRHRAAPLRHVRATSGPRPRRGGVGSGSRATRTSGPALRRCGDRRGQAPAASSPSVSGRMSIRHPVSRAARRAFWPSLPMASDSW